MDLDEIKETFEFLDDWEDKYRFIIDLGRTLPSLPEALRNETHLVRGCQSQVWLYVECQRIDEHQIIMNLHMDSDAHIVRGLIAIVVAALSGRSPREVLEFDIQTLFKYLELLQHLSPTRGNGLVAMLNRIHQEAGQRLD